MASAAVGLVALLGMIAALVATRGEETTGIGETISLASDPDRFSNSQEAAGTFARMAELLLEEVRSCASEDDKESVRCKGRAQAFTLAQTSAVVALQCTQPGIFELRTKSLAFLRAVERVEAAEAVELPRFPSLPNCR